MAPADPQARAEQFRARMERLGLTPGATARLMRVQSRTYRYWMVGKREIPETAFRVFDMYEALLAARGFAGAVSSGTAAKMILRKIAKALA